MAKQTINLGTAPTGVGGDTPRSAFTKAQANFDELYVALGASGSPASLPAAIPVAQGGTGGNTQATARTGLGLGSAAVSDAVGLMSNNAIIESGSNSSGTWTKYIDGTMICHFVFSTGYAINLAFGSVFYGSGPSLTFPQAFISAPRLSIQCQITGGGGWVGRGIAPTATATGPYIIISPISRSAETVAVEYIAVGRWKA